jgi:hypothetical protein
MTTRRTDRRALAGNALAMAISLRQGANLGLDGPIDIYGLCDHLSVPYRFVDVSMEGMYQRTPAPYIVLSALRPLSRRVYNCAHELGHHAFGHGLTVDALVQEHLASSQRRGQPGPRRTLKAPDEFLVDAFAGFLLMPLLALRKAYTARGLRPETATPAQHFTIACAFGVGYATLINHLAFGVKRLTRQRAETLLQVPLEKIRRGLIGEFATVKRLIVADQQWQLPTMDAEVGTHLLLPPGTNVSGDHMTPIADAPIGRLFIATRPGIARVEATEGHWAAFVRVSRFQYVGLGRYRHLDAAEDDADDDVDSAAKVTPLGFDAVLAGRSADGDDDD